MGQGQGSQPVATANHRTMDPLFGKAGRVGPWTLPWSRQSTSGLLCPAFPYPFPGAQRSRDPAKAPQPLKGQSQGKVTAGKGIQARQAVQPQEALSECGPDQRPVRQHKGLTLEDWREEDGAAGSRGGPYLSRGAPSSLWHGPGLQATLGALGLQPGPQGAMSAWPLSPGNASSWVLCGAGRGGGEGGGNLAGRQAAVSTCLLPAPLPQNRFGQSGVQEGGWNNGSPMPRRRSEGPQTES